MEHEWYDEDIENCMVVDAENKYIYVETVEDEDGSYTSCVQFKMEDLQYMANKLGGALQAVNPDEINLKFSREDIIMLAKTAGVTPEELV